jgi:hypothetical protein
VPRIRSSLNSGGLVLWNQFVVVNTTAIALLLNRLYDLVQIPTKSLLPFFQSFACALSTCRQLLLLERNLFNFENGFVSWGLEVTLSRCVYLVINTKWLLNWVYVLSRFLQRIWDIHVRFHGKGSLLRLSVCLICVLVLLSRHPELIEIVFCQWVHLRWWFATVLRLNDSWFRGCLLWLLDLFSYLCNQISP